MLPRSPAASPAGGRRAGRAVALGARRRRAELRLTLAGAERLEGRAGSARCRKPAFASACPPRERARLLELLGKLQDRAAVRRVALASSPSLTPVLTLARHRSPRDHSPRSKPACPGAPLVRHSPGELERHAAAALARLCGPGRGTRSGSRAIPGPVAGQRVRARGLQLRFGRLGAGRGCPGTGAGHCRVCPALWQAATRARLRVLDGRTGDDGPRRAKRARRSTAASRCAVRWVARWR